MTPSDGRWDVIGIGENSVDSVNLLPGYPQPTGPSAKMRIRERHVLCGGQMATAMCACASLGLRAKYVGVTGTDDNGRRIRAELQGRAVDITDLVIRDVENRFAVILVDENTGDRMVLWDRDDRLRLRESELPVDALAATTVVHVDDVDEDVAIRAARLARAAGAMVTSDIDRLTPRTEELAATVTHAIFAQHVPMHLTGLDDTEAALRALRKMFDNLLVVTMGDQGASALDGDRYYHEPAFPVHAVDTTGAGDVFRGGFIYALVHGQPIDEALRIANAAAAVSCTRLGALNGVPTLAEVSALLASRKVRV
jgi:sugar/nucleoside kinase (ribokinase family)